MKRRLTALTVALLLALTLLPAAALAKEKPALLTEFFPEGKITAPAIGYLQHTYDVYNSDELTLWYNMPAELRELADAYIEWDDISGEHEDFVARFGVEDYSVIINVDAKVDDGPWQYSADWDNPGCSGLEGPTYLAFECFDEIHSDTKIYYAGDFLSWLTYLGEDDAGFLEPIVKAVPDPEYPEETVYHYDLDEHTLGVRYRLGIRYVESSDAEPRIFFSEWSPEMSIGKNGTQKALSEPDHIDAPKLSDLEILVHSYDFGDETEAEFTVNFSENVYEGQMYCIAQAGMFEPYFLETEIRVDGDEWVDFYTGNPDWIFDGRRSGLSAEGYYFTTDSAVEVRARVVCDELGLVSPWSNTVGTDIVMNVDIAEVTFNDSSTIVNLSGEFTVASKIVVAGYDANGRLLHLAMGDNGVKSIPFARSKEDVKVKVFLLTPETMKPLCTAWIG